MKNLIFVVFTVILLSCEKKDAQVDSVYGEWGLIETYADPGDGSGTFQPIFSSKIVIIKTDGNVSSNGSLCYIGGDTGGDPEVFIGNYDSNENIIETEGCEFSTNRVFVELSNNALILSYSCIEGCSEKYAKL